MGEKEALTSAASVLDAAKPVIAVIEEVLGSLVKFFDASSDRVAKIASKAAAVSRSYRSIESSASEAIHELMVYMESIEAFALAFTSERMEDISAEILANQQSSHHRLLANFLKEVGRRLEMIEIQYEIVKQALRNFQDRCNEGREQCQLAKASARKEKAVTRGVGGTVAALGYAGTISCVAGSIAVGVLTGGVGLVAGLAVGGAAAAGTGAAATAITVLYVKDIDNLIGDLSAIEHSFASLGKKAKELQDTSLEAHAKVKSYCNEVDQLNMTHSNDHYDPKRIVQRLRYLARKAQSLLHLYNETAPRIKETVRQ